MSNFHHIHITITVFSNGSAYVYLCENNHGDINSSHLWHETDLTPYFQKVWELVKRGGKRTVEVNPYCPKCYTVDANWWDF